MDKEYRNLIMAINIKVNIKMENHKVMGNIVGLIVRIIGGILNRV